MASSMTKCKEKYESVRVLNPARVIETVMVFAVVVACGLAHLHLRFSVLENRRELTSLQAAGTAMNSELASARAELAELNQSSKLYEYAKGQLGLVPCNPDDREILTVSAAVLDRYAALPREAGREVVSAPEEDEAIWDRFAETRWGLVGEAEAGQE